MDSPQARYPQSKRWLIGVLKQFETRTGGVSEEDLTRDWSGRALTGQSQFGYKKHIND